MTCHVINVVVMSERSVRCVAVCGAMWHCRMQRVVVVANDVMWPCHIEMVGCVVLAVSGVACRECDGQPWGFHGYGSWVFSNPWVPIPYMGYQL